MTIENSPTFQLEQQVATLEQHVAELQTAIITLTRLLDDHLVRLPDDAKACPGFVVIEDSPAWECLARTITRTGGLRPGSIHPIRRAEFESLKTDLMAIEVETAKPD